MQIKYVWALASGLFLSSYAGAQIYEPGEVIVKLKGSAKSVTAGSFLSKVQMQKQMALQKSWSGLNTHHFKSVAGHTTQQLIDMYKTDPAVQYVEPNYILNKLDVEDGDTVTGLSESDVQGLSIPGEYSQSEAPIDAKEAWAHLSSGREKPIVAIIDTGVDYNHPVFKQSGAMWVNQGEIPNNGIDDDGNGYVDDIYGWNFVSDSNNPMDDNNHGTHVAGIVLGIGQDILNTIPREEARIQIMALKFLNNQGSGSTAAAIQAIYYAVDNGAKILNNSWGGPSYSAALHEAIAYAYNAQTVFVAAAGNAGADNDASPIYPANYNAPNMLAIASTTGSDFLSYFSNFGFSTVHLGSPGSSIKSTLPKKSFGFLSGTSMAAPAVAGIAALMLYEKPEMNGYQVKNILFGGAESVAGLNGKVSTQARINVLNSVVTAKGASVDPDQPSYSITVDQYSRDLASAMDSGAACGIVKNWNGASKPPYLALLLFALPLALFVLMKKRKVSGANRRVHERFIIDTDIAIKVGDRTLNGKVNSISQGGLRARAEELIEKGSVVTMKIVSPDGSETIEVQGNIVWSEQNQYCGIQFGSDQLAQATVANWTKKLKREET